MVEVKKEVTERTEEDKTVQETTEVMKPSSIFEYANFNRFHAVPSTIGKKKVGCPGDSMNAELLYMQNIDTNAHVDGGYILRSADKGNEVIPLLESEESMFNPSLSFEHESQEWYEYIRAYLLQMFQRIFFRSASRAGNFLGKNSLMIFLNSSVDKWIRYLVLPIPSLLMNSFCFIACLCFLIAMVSNTLYMMYYLTELGTMRHKHYRLSIEESKYGNPGVTDGMEFGLVANSCTLSLEGASRKSVGSSIYLSYPEPVEANGFYIIHNGSYPTKFLLEASEDLQTWSVHGASSKHFRCTGFFVIDWVYRPDIAYDFSKLNPEFIPNLCLQFGQEGLNSNCNNLIFVSNAWRWPMIFPIYMNMVIIAGLMVWIYASVKTEYAKNMKFPLLLLVLLSAGGCLIFAIIWCILPDMSGITQPENSMYAWNLFVLYLCFAWAVMKLYESNYVNLWYAYGNSAPVSEYWLASLYFLLIIAFAAGVHAGSAWSLHVANKRFEGYRDRIRRMVLDTLDDGGASSLLESMDTKVESLRDRRRSSGAILQDSPSAVDLGSMRFDLAATLSEFGSDAAMLQDSRDSCVQCLDQLFIQAEMLKPFLNMKVVEHAIRSEGLLLSTRNEWLTADQLKSDPETCRRVKWTSIKSMSRIVSKSFCSYEGETCLLTDVCRERIVFEDMRAMNKCLYSILEDPQMLVFRAKNSMKDCLTSNEEYHIGVILTVRLIMPQTHSLGISRHVCELQLMLRKFADLQDQSSHQEYVAYRNALVSEKLRISYNLRRTLHLLCRLWRPAHRPPRVSADNEALHDEAPEQLLMQEDSWVEKFCRSRACNAGDVVSSQLSVIHEAIAKASYSSCFFTSTPIAAALCKPVFQLLFVVIGVVYFAQLGWIIYGYMSNAYFQYQDFLFSVKKFDGIPLDQGNFTLASFGLLKRGCRVASAARIVQTSQASALISMKTSMLADGWYYELPPDTDPSAIPVAFTLDGSKDGKKWKLAGASVFVTGEAGWVVLSSRSNDNLRNKLGYQYEYIPSSVWLVSWIFTFFIGGALYWFAAFVSVLHQSVYVKHIGGLGYLFEVLFTLLPIPWLVVEGNWIAAIDFLLRGTCWALLGYFVRFAEQYWVIASAFVGIYFMAIELIIIFFLHADASSPAVPAHCRSSHQARQRQLHGNMGETAGGRVEHCTYGESTSHGRCHCASGKDTSANPGGHRAGLEGGRLCRALHNEPLSQSRPLAPASLQARAGAGAVPRPAPGTGGGTGRSHEISVPEVGGGVQWFLPHAR
eukprot:763427-Hanusia_phi.AAC.1